MTFDDLRAKFPTLGFGIYAMDPGKGVALEVYDGEQVFQFSGKTLQAAIDKAFPPPKVETVIQKTEYPAEVKQKFSDTAAEIYRSKSNIFD